MDKKLRRNLISRAMHIPPIFNIGKMGVTEVFLQEIDRAIEARELVKISVGKNCPFDCADYAREIAEKTNSEVIQIIGRKIILYRKREDEENYQQK